VKKHSTSHDAYFRHLKSITLLGKLYKRYITSPYLYACARRFGPKILEVGCGIGAGVLGAYPREVTGVDINPQAVSHCLSKGYNARLIHTGQTWDIPSSSFDACILDNVLEHVAEPSLLLRECARVTQSRGGLVVAVPGSKGFASDGDHKVNYDDTSLRDLNHGWTCTRLTGLPLWVGRRFLSKRVRQFCFVAVYGKTDSF
jgi:SAM-dependent methyltransferase